MGARNEMCFLITQLISRMSTDCLHITVIKMEKFRNKSFFLARDSI